MTDRERLLEQARETERRYGWKCMSCGEVLTTGSFLKIANDRGELAHDGGMHECGPVVGTVRMSDAKS